MFVSHLHGDHYGGLPFLILDGQFSRRTARLLIVGPPGTRQRLTEAMECLFPGSSQVRRRFEVTVTELPPGGTQAVAGLTARGVGSEPSQRCAGPDPAAGRRRHAHRLHRRHRVDARDQPRRPATPTCSSPRRTCRIRPSRTTCGTPTSPESTRSPPAAWILTHMSADMFARPTLYETARDGMAITI